VRVGEHQGQRALREVVRHCRAKKKSLTKPSLVVHIHTRCRKNWICRRLKIACASTCVG
jgi:hypothetical protein